MKDGLENLILTACIAEKKDYWEKTKNIDNEFV